MGERKNSGNPRGKLKKSPPKSVADAPQPQHDGAGKSAPRSAKAASGHDAAAGVKTRKPKKKELVPNIQALAELVGMHRTNLWRAMQHEHWRWPKEAPWDLEQAQQIRAMIELRRQKGRSERELRRMLMRAQITKLKAQVAVIRATYVPREKYENDRMAIVLAFRAALMEIRSMTPDLLGCRTPARIDAVLEDWARTICERLAEQRQKPS